MNEEDFEKLVEELENYVEKIRDDWSHFDGRELRNYVCYDWIPRLRKAVGEDSK